MNNYTVAELQAEVDYFTDNPEAYSPAPGFELGIIPEGLTTADEQAIAEGVQAKITPDCTPHIRSEEHNDMRTREVTDKGYRIVFFPKHYNVPKGTTQNQTSWIHDSNQHRTATELQTATDAEALNYINGLADAGVLDCPHQTSFTRFDQDPRSYSVSSVDVSPNGKINLYLYSDHFYSSSRALVVPRA